MWPPQAFKVGDRVKHNRHGCGTVTRVRKSLNNDRQWIFDIYWDGSYSSAHYEKMLTFLDFPEHTPCEVVLATTSQTAICRCSFVGLGHDNGCEYVAAMEEAHNLLKDRE